jgi:hypothetical protein
MSQNCNGIASWDSERWLRFPVAWPSWQCRSTPSGAIAQRARAEAGAAGELAPPKVGMARWDALQSVRVASLGDLASGRYYKAAQAVTHGDLEMTQG